MDTAFIVKPTDFRPARGGTKFRHLKIHDTVCLLKERELLKGKKVRLSLHKCPVSVLGPHVPSPTVSCCGLQVCVLMDLTPNMKREFSGCILSFSDLQMGENGLERVHKKTLLPLMHVCSKVSSSAPTLPTACTPAPTLPAG